MRYPGIAAGSKNRRAPAYQHGHLSRFRRNRDNLCGRTAIPLGQGRLFCGASLACASAYQSFFIHRSYVVFNERLSTFEILGSLPRRTGVGVITIALVLLTWA